LLILYDKELTINLSPPIKNKKMNSVLAISLLVKLYHKYNNGANRGKTQLEIFNFFHTVYIKLVLSNI